MQQLAVRQQSESLQGKRNTSAPFVSAIVPVRNEAAFIADTLHQLLEQRYPADRFEVIVADGQSTDDTRTIVAALQTCYDNLRLIDNPLRLSSAGRNAAIRAARGEIIVLIDGHCQLSDPHYLDNLADAFARSGADCVGRPQPQNVQGASRLQHAIAAARASWLGHHPASHVYSKAEGFVPPQSVAVAYRRGVFDDLGGFDERFDACEDFEFNHRVARAGFSCWFSPRVTVRYFPRSHLHGLFRQMIRYGRGRVRLLRKHPDTISFPGFVPAAFLAGVLLGPLLASISTFCALLYFGTLCVYTAVLTLFSVTLSARERDLRLLPLFPLVFLSIHAGAGVGVWWELFFGQRRVHK